MSATCGWASGRSVIARAGRTTLVRQAPLTVTRAGWTRALMPARSLSRHWGRRSCRRARGQNRSTDEGDTGANKHGFSHFNQTYRILSLVPCSIAREAD